MSLDEFSKQQEKKEKENAEAAVKFHLMGEEE